MNEANSNISPSQACVDLVKKSEGCRLKAYKDAVGVLTIGWGSTTDVRPGMVITQQEADDRLYAAIDDFWQSVYSLVNVPLTQGQADALTDFCYNLGAKSLAKSSLLAFLNKGQYEEAAQQFDKWVFAGGHKLPGLVTRRAAEKAMFLGDADA